MVSLYVQYHLTTTWTGQPVLGFMAETNFDDLAIVGLKDFNPMWSFPSTSVSQNWDHIAFGMEASHLKENPGHAKDALVSQSPIVVFKASMALQSLDILASRIVLPSSDVKGEKKKNRTYCPTTWNYAYIYDTPATYSDLLRREGAHSLLSHECVLSVIVQLSNENAAHPQCSFADSESSVLSSLMVSLTPIYKAKIEGSIKLSEAVEFESIEHVRKVLNEILSKADDFVPAPTSRPECRVLTFPKGASNKQYVNCPEQDCENLVYHYDQAKSMIEIRDPRVA